jgi:CheY-like chemotaxis protein
VKRFLVVDDDPAIGRMLTLLLQHDGHQALAVTSAAEALDHLRTSDVDIVLSELLIGSSMDGLQLAACVRREWPYVQFVLGTRSMGLGAALAHGEGPEMILTKPYRLSDLRQIVGVSAGMAEPAVPLAAPRPALAAAAERV